MAEIELIVGKFLRAGVITCAAVLSLGVALGAAQRPEANLVLQSGVLLLILLPVSRVAILLVLFARQRDGIYAALSAFVLAVLLFGLAFGGSHAFH